MRERERERERKRRERKRRERKGERERETEETEVGERAHGTKVNPKDLQTKESSVQAVAADKESVEGNE